jgi:hypothetical protein
MIQFACMLGIGMFTQEVVDRSVRKEKSLSQWPEYEPCVHKSAQQRRQRLRVSIFDPVLRPPEGTENSFRFLFFINAPKFLARLLLQVLQPFLLLFRAFMLHSYHYGSGVERIKLLQKPARSNIAE